MDLVVQVLVQEDVDLVAKEHVQEDVVEIAKVAAKIIALLLVRGYVPLVVRGHVLVAQDALAVQGLVRAVAQAVQVVEVLALITAAVLVEVDAKKLAQEHVLIHAREIAQQNA